MTPPPPLPLPSPEATNPAVSGAIRIGFFMLLVIGGMAIFSWVFYGISGNAQVSATLTLAGTGLLANLLTMSIFDRRPFADLGLHFNRKSLIHAAMGIMLGGGAATLLLIAPLIAGAGHLVLRPSAPPFNWSSLIVYLFTLVLGATGEETIFHGYAFQYLVEKAGPFAAVLPVGLLFGLAHMSNEHSDWLGIVNTAIWGVLLGYAFLRSHDLWLPIGMHFGWNAVLPLFGVNLSGITIEVTRYFYKWDLSSLWSGGAYGPEGGLLTTIFAVILFFVVHRAPVRPQYAAIAKTLNEAEV